MLDELNFTASKSSGPGGQNVNKVNTRVELHFPLEESAVFSEEEKRLIALKLSNRINATGSIFLASDSERSQLRNKEKVIQKFFELIEKALKPQKKRKKTTPTRASKVKRLESKKHLSQKKERRKNSGF